MKFFTREIGDCEFIETIFSILRHNLDLLRGHADIDPLNELDFFISWHYLNLARVGVFFKFLLNPFVIF